MESYVQQPESLKKPLIVPNKKLMGPGPSNASERVLKAMSNPILGHLHSETLQIMEEIKDGIRYIFQTKNPATFCISASGHAGMEAVLCNLLEDGDVILIGVTGIWGIRAGEMARRYGADVRFIESKCGQPLEIDRIRCFLEVHKPVAFFITQGDSSTGVLQQIKGLGELCHSFNCLLIVDTVASLGGTPFLADEWQVDAVYTGSQKVLGAPPGITPITFSQRALNRIGNRNSKVKVYYFDAMLLGDYWGCFGRPRIYHHTIAPTLLYGLREALAITCEEGLNNIIKRHQDLSKYLQSNIEAMGLEMFVPNVIDRMSTVNSIHVPNDVDWKVVSDYAMKNHLVEISGGLGPTVGKIFRIGLMGINATKENVDMLLDVLSEALKKTSNFIPKKISKI